MKRFTIPCTFGIEKAPFHIYVGEPAPSNHPLLFQSAWLATRRNGTIPAEVMESFEKLHKIALESNVSFEELCVYALGTAPKPGDGSAGSSGSAGSGGSGDPA